MLAQILAYTTLGSLGSLVGAGVLLSFPRVYHRVKGPMLGFAVAMLLGTTLSELLPDALALAPAGPVLMTVLAGVLTLLCLELALHAGLPPHESAPHESAPNQLGHYQLGPRGLGHNQPGGRRLPLSAAIGVMIGDTLHNFVDGVLIAAAFLTSPALGIATSIAVFAHEIPHELGDFVICIQAGWRPRTAFLANVGSAIAALAGALAAYFARQSIEPYLPYLLAFGAATFLYIALADIVPDLHHEHDRAAGAWQLAGLLAGLGVLALLHLVLEQGS